MTLLKDICAVCGEKLDQTQRIQLYQGNPFHIACYNLYRERQLPKAIGRPFTIEIHEDDLLEIGQQAFSIIAEGPTEDERKFLFATPFIYSLLKHLEKEFKSGNLDYLAEQYIDKYWDEQHSPSAMKLAEADRGRDENR